jgi:hypothetical protein
MEQTSTYLNVRAGGLLDSMRKLDTLRNAKQSDKGPLSVVTGAPDTEARGAVIN